MNWSQVIAYEQGELAYDEVVALFQDLLDTGDVWLLQGAYGRTAMALLNAGELTS